MKTESARMSSAAEARYRIDAPNSKPRSVKVIALDHPSERVVKDLAERKWNNASLLHRVGIRRRAKTGRKLCRLAERSCRPHQEPDR